MHRGQGRVDVRVAHHELLENVVLDGSGELFLAYALFFGRYDVECQYRKHGSVHGHRYGHFVQRYSVEQHFHVLYRADGHSGFTYVAYYAGVVCVITAVCRKVECHRKTFLACGQVTAVECVRFCGSGETGVLAHCPGALNVHRRVRPAQERRKSGSVLQVLGILDIFFRKTRLYVYVFGRFPYRYALYVAFCGRKAFYLQVFCFYFGKIRFHFMSLFYNLMKDVNNFISL